MTTILRGLLITIAIVALLMLANSVRAAECFEFVPATAKAKPAATSVSATAGKPYPRATVKPPAASPAPRRPAKRAIRKAAPAMAPVQIRCPQRGPVAELILPGAPLMSRPGRIEPREDWSGDLPVLPYAWELRGPMNDRRDSPANIGFAQVTSPTDSALIALPGTLALLLGGALMIVKRHALAGRECDQITGWQS